jgi:hypothetical protein
VEFICGVWDIFFGYEIFMKNGKYFIVLFCNKKKVKILHRCQKKTTIYEYWREFRTERPPRFLKTQGMKRNTEVLYELALIFPNNRWSKKTFVKDSLGRLMEAKMENEKLRIKEIVPYWKEELIYDFQQKKRIRYHEMFDEILKVTEIGQVFTLNNKLFIQNDNNIKLYGNKNIKDADRLFELVREDLIKKKRGNFIFVKDVTTAQRKQLYTLLESKGFKRSELFRHYSY